MVIIMQFVDESCFGSTATLDVRRLNKAGCRTTERCTKSEPGLTSIEWHGHQLLKSRSRD